MLLQKIYLANLTTHSFPQQAFLDLFWAHPNATVVLSGRPSQEWERHRRGAYNSTNVPIDRPCGLTKFHDLPANLITALLGEPSPSLSTKCLPHNVHLRTSQAQTCAPHTPTSIYTSIQSQMRTPQWYAASSHRTVSLRFPRVSIPFRRSIRPTASRAKRPKTRCPTHSMHAPARCLA